MIRFKSFCSIQFTTPHCDTNEAYSIKRGFLHWSNFFFWHSVEESVASSLHSKHPLKVEIWGGQSIIGLHIPIYCAMKQDSLIIRVRVLLCRVIWRCVQPSGSPTRECPIKSSALRRSSAGGQSEVNWFLQTASQSISSNCFLAQYTQIYTF